MTRIAAILLVLFTLGITPTLHAQSDSAPPYLYYYSQLLGGLIIERADGTASRQIAADVIPPNLTGLAGPGWSPSGKYFAAYGVKYDAFSGSTTAPYLIDLQGKPIAYWLSGVRSDGIMEWSPTGEDILLVIGNFNQGYQAHNLGSFVWLIDAAHDKVLAEFGVNVATLAYSMSTITWDVAHQQVLFYLASDTYNFDDHYRVTLHFDGTTLREPVPAADFVGMYKSMDMNSNPDIQNGDNISPDGRYTAHGTYLSQLSDNRTGKTVNLPIHTQATICRDYIWSTNETYMITLDGTLIAGGGCAPAVMGITNPTGTFWRELGGCSWDNGTCAGWLPEHVDFSTLPSGTFKPVQLDPIKIEYANETQYSIDPAKTRLLNFRCTQDSTADIRDPDAQEVIYQLKATTCPYNLYHNRIPEIGQPIVVAEDPVHHLLATYSDGQSFGVSIWKLKDNLYEPLLKLNTWGLSLEFTDHNERLRARNFNGWKIYAVADILAAASTQNEVHS